MKKSEIRNTIINALLESLNKEENIYSFSWDLNTLSDSDINSEEFKEVQFIAISDFTEDEFNHAINILNEIFKGEDESSVKVRNKLGNFFFEALAIQRQEETTGGCVHDELRMLFYKLKLMADL